MSLLTAHRSGFPHGFTAVTTLEDQSGIALGVRKLNAFEAWREALPTETAWLLMSGRLKTGAQTLQRGSVFDDPAVALHGGAGCQVELSALTPTELLELRTANPRPFPLAVYAQVSDEHRGRGAVHDAAYRLVRTAFDATTAPPQAELVLGEVVNLPGRWSSYPPHHHPQPELYHYRFDRPQGFGHAELGEQVYKVKSFDTLRIVDGADHPQCAAPGYAMWYAWVIRHLPHARYAAPDFAPAHRWALEEGAQAWAPRGARDRDE